MVIKNRSKGFTLIELAVVMAIISVLAALMTPNIMNELNQRRADITAEETQQIVDAARAYRIKTGSWPGNTTCSDALTVLTAGSTAYLAGVKNINRYNSAISTSCTALSFSVDQNAVADWDGYIVNSLAATQIVDSANHGLRTTVGIPGSEPALDSKLSRIATGNAELNRMRTTLLLGGNDVTEVGRVSAANGSFTGDVTTSTLTVAQTTALQGLLTVAGESQFTGKAKFNDEVVLLKKVSEGQTGCTTGAIARDVNGLTLSCQSGVWRTIGALKFSQYKSGSCQSPGNWKAKKCPIADSTWAICSLAGAKAVGADESGRITRDAAGNWILTAVRAGWAGIFYWQCQK